jgi:SAM-dependent methyltransferase
MISFICNICGRHNDIETLRYEPSSCAGCGSNVRLRALMYMLSMELFGQALVLPEFPRLPGIRGIGLSDQWSYSERLAEKFDYTNTYYDREPRLDITTPHPDRHGTYDFILSSDVFEHIASPVERALEETHRLLKPHGVLCVTVPSSVEENTIERFPDLHEYSVADLAGTLVLINRKKDGTLEIHDNLMFHGGVGATLEMRLFSQKDLERKLRAAGFEAVVFQSESVPRFGIVFEGKWSLPLVARKREFVLEREAAGQLVTEYRVVAGELAELRKRYQDAEANLAARGGQVDRLNAELAERAAWVSRVEEEHRETIGSFEVLRTEFDERTRWALQLNSELEEKTRAATALQSGIEELEARLAMIASSRWIRLGNRMGVGPKLG